jgi:hypothetical protein
LLHQAAFEGNIHSTTHPPRLFLLSTRASSGQMVPTLIFRSSVTTTAEWFAPDFVPPVFDGVRLVPQEQSCFMQRTPLSCYTTANAAAVTLQSPRCPVLPRLSDFHPSQLGFQPGLLASVMTCCRQSPRHCDFGTAKERTGDRLGSIPVSCGSTMLPGVRGCCRHARCLQGR